MTKSTITRERAQQIFLGNGPEPSASEERELARMTLVAMDSEPVAYIFKHPAGRLFWSLTDKSNKGHDDVMPVYASPQPAPIVEREPIAWLNDAYLARGVVDGEAGSEDAGPGYIPVYRHAQPAPVVQEGYKLVPTELTNEMVKAFRSFCEAYDVDLIAGYKAMLAAAPQSPGGDHATVPGKWIPVSERMPEIGDIVLTAMGGAVNVGEMECSAANCRFFTSVISGRELPATHWMPLPAGPKEDINALIPLVSRNEQEGK
ncbi:TPA: DUF551 domain-containing protein [Klebsiella pneumoniae]